ncbi:MULTISPECIES: hypothetical protein [Nitrosomonas]|uniref:hypothetical protein n=1 Tax=Nitrosomonas TaxID=914 RepID=UPI0011B1F6BC|nr:hypothetical protein [Nitrosomonas oligotropha]
MTQEAAQITGYLCDCNYLRKIDRGFSMTCLQCQSRTAIILIHAYYYGKIRALDGIIETG